MIAIIWRFRPPSAEAARFEAAYGPNGDWANLFRTSDGYVRTELLRGKEGEYVTLDYWRDEASWEAFFAAQRSDYDRLNERFNALNALDEKIGIFLVDGSH